MSSMGTGVEGRVWLALCRMAEPVMARLLQERAESLEAASRIARPEFSAAIALTCEEDAERWDGMS